MARPARAAEVLEMEQEWQAALGRSRGPILGL